MMRTSHFHVSMVQLKKVRVFPNQSKSLSTTSNKTSVLYSWGIGTNGQLGHQKFGLQSGVLANKSYTQYEPRKMMKSSKFIKVACAYEYSLGLDSDGLVYGWGTNYVKDQSSHEPKLIPFPAKIISIACGANHNAAVDENNQLYTWGHGGTWMKGGGQLCHNSRESENSPRLVDFFKEYGAKVAKASCGAHHTLILTTDGEVLAAGVGEYGRLGVGSSEDAYLPTTVDTLINETIIDVQASHNHSACLTKDGKVYSWGKNDSGQLGHLDTNLDVLYSQEEYPRIVENLPKIKQISLTKSRTAAVSEEGKLYIWGSQFQHYPILIDPDLFNHLNVEKVICAGGTGGTVTFVITEDKSLWSFGDMASCLLGKKLSDLQKMIGKDITPKRVSFTSHAHSIQSSGSNSNGSSTLSSPVSSLLEDEIRVVDVFAGLGRHAFARVEVPAD